MTDTKSTMLQTGISNTTKTIRIATDRVHRLHLRQTYITTGSADRFLQFQKQFIRGAIPIQSVLCRLSISLICFDGISTKEDLLAALNNRTDAYVYDEMTCIDWEYPNGRCNRRYLSPFTVRALQSAVTLTVSTNELLEQIEFALTPFYPSASSRLNIFLSDAKAWLTQILPGPLWAHCLCEILLSALPRKTLARKSASMVIQHSSADQEDETEVAMGIALDGYFSSHKKDGGSSVVYKVKSVCQRKPNLPHDHDKRRMLKGCMALALEAQESGPISSLLLSWVIDLIESGTPTLENISPATIQKYVGNTLAALFQHFRNIEIETLTSEQFTDIYHVILEAALPSQKQTTSSALVALHSFLEIWLEVAPLHHSLYDGIEPTIPRANVVWPHEIQTMLSWLGSASSDERSIQQMIVSLHIATSARIRITELIKLRLNNFSIHPDGVQIEVSPLRRDGKLKSSSSRRIMMIRDEKAVTIVAEWINRRKLEGAFSNDLLFADPHKPDHGFRLGQLYVSLNLLLKSATGDKKSSFHTLSHNWVSFQFERALLDECLYDVNPLDQLSAAAAHASSQTSLIHYFHLFEKTLRYHLDRALLNSIKFTGPIVATYSNTSSAAYRQRCARSKSSPSKAEIAWQAICQTQQELDWPDAHSIFALTEASPPSFLTACTQLKYFDVVKIMCDLANGMTAPVVSSRSGKSEELVNAIAALGCVVLEDINMLNRVISQRDAVSAIVNLQEALASCMTKIDFSRIQQPKLAPILKLLNARPDPLIVTGALNSWICCFKDGYISLTQPANCSALIRFISEAKFPNDCIFVCVSESDGDEIILRSLNSIFSASGLPTPYLLKLKSRRGRPSHYISISSIARCEGQDIGGAALSVAGLNAVMFSACIFARLNSYPAYPNNTYFNPLHHTKD